MPPQFPTNSPQDPYSLTNNNPRIFPGAVSPAVNKFQGNQTWPAGDYSYTPKQYSGAPYSSSFTPNAALVAAAKQRMSDDYARFGNNNNIYQPNNPNFPQYKQDIASYNDLRTGGHNSTMGRSDYYDLTGSSPLQLEEAEHVGNPFRMGNKIMINDDPHDYLMSHGSLPPGFPTFKKGGKMPYTGMAMLHKGERVLNTKQTRQYDRKKGMAEKMPKGQGRNQRMARTTLGSSGRNEGETMMGNNYTEHNRS